MNLTDIEKKIAPYFVDEFEVERELIQPEANMRETLQLDSLDYVDLVVAIEGHFNFKVKQTDFQNIFTFNDLYTYIQERIHPDHASTNS